jgi:hypothetical protein
MIGKVDAVGVGVVDKDGLNFVEQVEVVVVSHVRNLLPRLETRKTFCNKSLESLRL